jgi:hypothetical protein
MRTPHTARSLVPLFLIGLLALFVMPVHAQGDRSSAPQVHFKHKPHWQRVAGTHVSVVREDERQTDYDVFNYKSHYYVHGDAGWYHAKKWNGEYQPIDEAKVPSEFRKVPREHWGHYPSSWSDQNHSQDNARRDSHPH